MSPISTIPTGHSPLTDHDLYLFNEGSHFRLYEKLGAHPMTVEGTGGTYFAVWAQNADRVQREIFPIYSYENIKSFMEFSISAT